MTPLLFTIIFVIVISIIIVILPKHDKNDFSKLSSNV